MDVIYPGFDPVDFDGSEEQCPCSRHADDIENAGIGNMFVELLKRFRWTSGSEELVFLPVVWLEQELLVHTSDDHGVYSIGLINSDSISHTPFSALRTRKFPKKCTGLKKIYHRQNLRVS